MKRIAENRLKYRMENRSNNLEIMKLFAAFLVIIHHAYALTANPNEKISIITKGQLDYGTLAVSLFFFVSGLFIAKSMEKLKTFKKFFSARVIRLCPPLFAVVFLSMVMGGFITVLPLKDYLFNAVTWKYCLNSVFILQHNLPGVFENNVYGKAVNGALWTLPLEVLCYILCFVLYKLKVLQKKSILFVMSGYILIIILGSYIFAKMELSLLTSAFRPVYFFLLGLTAYVYRENIVLDVRLFYIACLGCILGFVFSIPVVSIWIIYPYILLYLAFAKRQIPEKYGKFFWRSGGYSYTIYLCAFPIQQLIIHWYGGNMNTYLNLLLSTLFAGAMGILLHHLVEKPTLSWHMHIN